MRGKFDIRELALPVGSISLAIYLVTQQVIDDFPRSTLTYSLILAVPLVVLSCAVVWQRIAVHLRNSALDRERIHTDSHPKGPSQRGNAGRLIAFLLLTVILIFILSKIGYIISFGVFLAASSWLLGVRSVRTISLTVCAGVLFIYLIFVVWLQVPLPPGLLEHLRVWR